MPKCQRGENCENPALEGTDPPACYVHSSKGDRTTYYQYGQPQKPTKMRVLVVEVPIRDGETVEVLSDRLRQTFAWRGPVKIYEKDVSL